MPARSPQHWLSAISSAFERRNWRDNDFAALRIVEALQVAGAYDEAVAVEALPTSFLERNAVEATTVLGELEAAVGGWAFTGGGERPSLIAIDDIESFARVAEVTAQEVADISAPLDLREVVIKKAISKIVGEPHVDHDWGGELGDIFTSQVRLAGKRVNAAFLLKGRGLRTVLWPNKLGKNGDQLVRLSKLPADLFVVQHVNRIDPSVTDQLRMTILALRSEGRAQAVGSVWEGSDTARLLSAYGLIDSSTGRTIDQSLET